MNRGIWLCGVLVLGLCMVPACQRRPAPDPEEGGIDYLVLDENENGFPDVPVPEGVEVEETGTVNVHLANTISQEDVAALVKDFIDVEADLLDLVDITLNMTITLSYDGGITDVLEDSEPFVPFEKLFEVACPNVANVAVEVVAEIPFVGPQTLEEFDADLTQGVEFECGQTLEVEAFTNDNGFPDITVTVS